MYVSVTDMNGCDRAATADSMGALGYYIGTIHAKGHVAHVQGTMPDGKYVNLDFKTPEEALSFMYRYEEHK